MHRFRIADREFLFRRHAIELEAPGADRFDIFRPHVDQRHVVAVLSKIASYVAAQCSGAYEGNTLLFTHFNSPSAARLGACATMSKPVPFLATTLFASIRARARVFHRFRPARKVVAYPLPELLGRSTDDFGTVSR